MFALAFYDNSTGIISLARDYSGEKPLYYSHGHPDFAFSSEVNSLASILGDVVVNEKIVSEYLAFGYTSEDTLIKGIRKLKPGYICEFNTIKGEVDLVNWRHLIDDQRPHVNEGLKGFRDSIDTAINRVCLSDVGFSTLISGGIDSALVNYAVKEFCPSRGGDFNAYTVKFDDNSVDESDDAIRTAKLLGLNHSIVDFGAVEIRELIEDLVLLNGEPFGDYSQLPTMLVYKSIAGKSKVVLSGDGSDELFAGYSRYSQVETLANFRKVLKVVPFKSTLLNWCMDERRARRLLAVVNKPANITLYEEFIKINQIDTDSRAVSSAFGLREMMDYDFTNYLPNDILYKVDISSMSSSIESRTPFLDIDLIGYSKKLKRDDLISSRYGGKSILKSFLGETILEEIIKRPKSGFGPPLGEWMRNELKDYFYDGVFLPNHFVEKVLPEGYIHQIWDDHQARRGNFQHELWVIFTFKKWCFNLGQG
jgi:asparagine synthase (glutamine-hydrolysing)